MVSELSTRGAEAAAQGSEGASAIAALAGGAAAPEGLDLDALSRFARVLQAPPVYNYQTVYGVIMVPSKQCIVPVI